MMTRENVPREISGLQKLSPRFVEPFEILERIGPVAYRLALPPSLSAVHDVFHVSMSRKYVTDPSHVVDYEPLEIDENLSYSEQPVEVLARESRVHITDKGSTMTSPKSTVQNVPKQHLPTNPSRGELASTALATIENVRNSLSCPYQNSPGLSAEGNGLSAAQRRKGGVARTTKSESSRQPPRYTRRRERASEMEVLANERMTDLEGSLAVDRSQAEEGSVGMVAATLAFHPTSTMEKGRG
ncbi:pol protein [Cucumis melo var. makuwa]|uniref:Pol protein n=1 Tax=Cucumis melo var. makuwa TaxID=1194695 RepID=A0A5D3CMS5_CUCMM|nr:pol protein [Cucumis melo var. makuwa]